MSLRQNTLLIIPAWITIAISQRAFIGYEISHESGFVDGRRISFSAFPLRPVTASCTHRYNLGYTTNMKTAVSVPDDLFQAAETTARRLRVSRSELYSKAISEFLKKEDGSEITKRLNEVYSAEESKLDSRLHDAQLKSLPKDVW